MSLPTLLYASHIKALLGHKDWTTRRVRQFMKANGLALMSPSGAVHTTSAILEERMPELHRAMTMKWESIEAGLEFDPDNFDDI